VERLPNLSQIPYLTGFLDSGVSKSSMKPERRGKSDEGRPQEKGEERKLKHPDATLSAQTGTAEGMPPPLTEPV